MGRKMEENARDGLLSLGWDSDKTMRHPRQRLTGLYLMLNIWEGGRAPTKHMQDESSGGRSRCPRDKEGENG